MTDNRTTEQRNMLNRLLIELDSLEVVLERPTSGMTLGEYEQEREKLLDGFIQAIAATLENGTCRLVGTLYYDGEGIWYHELSCGHEVETLDKEPPSYCPECGARVEP